MPVVGMLAPVRPTAWVPWGTRIKEDVKEARQVKSSQVKCQVTSSQVKSSQGSVSHTEVLFGADKVVVNLYV